MYSKNNCYCHAKEISFENVTLNTICCINDVFFMIRKQRIKKSHDLGISAFIVFFCSEKHKLIKHTLLFLENLS